MTDLPAKILKALTIQKHLTASQLAKLLKSPYKTVANRLKQMENEGLLLSDSYGVMVQGVEKFWRIFPHQTGTATARDAKKSLSLYGYRDVKPAPKMHSKLYWHEMHCGDLFVAFASTGNLWTWEDGEVLGGCTCDKVFGFTEDDGENFLLEQEEGNQYERIEAKVLAYVEHWRETKETRKFFATVPDQNGVEKVRAVFKNLHLPEHYFVAVLSELTTAPLEAKIYSTRREYTLLQAAEV
jgi:hypothetical protein